MENNQNQTQTQFQSERTADLWIRQTVPDLIRREQEQVYERLRQLREQGVLAEITVNHWNSYTYLGVNGGIPSEEPAGDMFSAIERWATEHGYELAPAFETYPADESAAGHHQCVVNLPIICLVIYHGENIEGVVPCSTANRIYTVRDGLTQLETEHRLVLTTSAAEAADSDS